MGYSILQVLSNTGEQNLEFQGWPTQHISKGPQVWRLEAQHGGYETPLPWFGVSHCIGESFLNPLTKLLIFGVLGPQVCRPLVSFPLGRHFGF
jgi:hypothetical protein